MIVFKVVYVRIYHYMKVIFYQGHGWSEEPITHHVCLPLEKDGESPTFRTVTHRLHLSYIIFYG